MQVVQRRSFKSHKAVAGVLAAAVAGLGLSPTVVQAASLVWSGAPTAPYNWSLPGNWNGGIAPVAGDDLTFDLTSAGGLNPINDLVANTLITGLSFGGGATSSYNLAGNTIDFQGDLANFSSADQLISMGVRLRANINVFTSERVLTLSGPLNSSGNFGIIKNDAGTLTLAGPVTYNGNTNITNGKVMLTGSVTQGNGPAINIANTANQNGALILNGSANWTKGNTLIEVGMAANAHGAIVVNAGTVFNTTGEIWLGSAATGSGSIIINGGSLSTGSWLALGRARTAGAGAGTGVITVNSGLLTVNGNPLTIGSFNNGAALVPALRGVVTVKTGGSLVVNNSIRVGETYNGNLNLLGGSLTVTGNIDVVNGGNPISGIFSMNGGFVSVGDFRSSGGSASKSATLNFNGGIVQARGANNAFIASTLSTVNIWNGGLTIDDQGFNLTIAEPLRAPTGNGIAMGTLSVSGSGYVGEPVVEITGGGGTGAAAVVQMDNAGNITGLTIVSPGIGYTAEPTITLVGGGGSGGVSGSAALVANTSSGGLTKIGAGTMTLSAQNTYTGPTNVNGTLVLAGGSDTVAAASQLVLNGATVRINGTGAGTNTQSFSGTVLNDGPNSIVLVPNGAANNMTLALGAINRAGGPGALLNLTIPATGSVSGTIAHSNPAGGQNSIIGGWATVNGSSWATSTGGVIAGLTVYEPGFVAGKDVDVPAGTSTPGAMTINSLRFNAPAVADVNTTGNLVIANGGILVTSNVGNNAVSINNNSLSAGAAAGELIIHQYNTSNALTIGSMITGASSLIKLGGGKVNLTNPANSYTGSTMVYEGTLNAVADGSLSAANLILQGGGLQLGGSFNSTRNIELNGAGGTIDTNGFNTTQSGVISGLGSLTKSGTGVLNIAGNTTFSGGLTVNAGTLEVSGVINTAPLSNAQVTVGTGATPGILKITGGTLTANKPNAPSLVVASNAGAQGYLLVESGILTTATEAFLGNNVANTFAHMGVSGGTTTIGSWLSVGRGAGTSTFVQSGGVLNITTNFMAVANITGTSLGHATFSGGEYNAIAGSGGLLAGENGKGIIDVTGTASLNVAGNGLRVGVNDNSYGVLNLAGGVLTTNRVRQANTSPASTASTVTTVGLINFHGGTLRANTNATTWFTNTGTLSTNVAATYIWSEGGTIDDGGFAVTVTAALANPNGNGVSVIPVTNGGSGYLTAPVVNITGGDGKGATATALLAGGVITGIAITNPGVGYTTAPTATFLGGSGTGAVAGTLELAANSAAGTLTKAGSGTLSLSSSAHTFTGPTNVAAGKLRLVGNTWNSATSVASGAALSAASGLNTTISQAVTVAGGGAIDLIDNAAGTLTLASGLTMGAGSASSLKFDFAGNVNPAVGNDMIVLTGGTFDPGTGVSVSLNNLGSMATGASYTLMTYAANPNPGAVTLNADSQKIGFDTASLLVDGTKVVVTISGAAIPANAWWTGTHGALWSVIGPGNQSNFNTTQTGGINTQKFPALTTNVFFATTTPVAQNLNTTLGGNFSVNGVTVKSGTGAVSIAGEGGQVLTLYGGGITVESGSSLDISAGVRLNAAQTWSNASATPLVVSGVVSGTGGGLTTTGLVTLSGANTFSTSATVTGGTLTLSNAAALGTASLTVNGPGRVQINNVTVAAAGLNGNSTGIVEAAGTVNGTLSVGTTGTSTFLGTIQNHELGGLLGLIMNGGTLTLGNAGTQAQVNIGDDLRVRRGVLNVVNAAISTPTDVFFVGDTNGARAQLIIGDASSGPSITTRNVRQSFQVGQTDGAIGDVRMNNGSLTTGGPLAELWLGEEASTSSYAAMTVIGGNVNSGSYFVVGFNGDRAVLNVSGGTVNVNSNVMTIGAGGNASFGVVNLTGGQINSNGSTVGGFFVGENGLGILEISGSGVATASFQGTRLANNGGSTGIINLRGGTLATNRLFGTAAGAATVNFDGGRLVNNNNTSGSWVFGLTNAYVWGGGANLDDNGGTVTIAQALTAPTGNGLANTLAVTGFTGAINTPLVSITGGGGSGATGLANINEATGQVTSITVTNPGVGYTSLPTVSLLGGGVGNGTITGRALAVNVGGGLNKFGSGVVILTSSANNYTGPTVIHQGTLALANNAALVGGGAVTVNSGATLAGTGAMSTVIGNVTVNGTLSMVNSAMGTMTLTGTTTIDNGMLAVDVSPLSADVINTNQLIANSGTVTINNLGLQPGKTYTLANFSASTYGAGFVLDPSVTTIGLNTLTLQKNATSLVLNVTGPALPTAAYWTGQFSSNWDTLSGSNTNFNTTISGGTNTGQLPGTVTDVFFSTTNPAVVSPVVTNLGSSMAIKSLNVLTGNDVTVNGTETAVLDIEGTGISVAAGGSLTLNTHLILGSVQNWTLATPVTVSGNISGIGGINLAGNLTLNSTTNTFSGGVTIGDGSIVTINGGGLGTGPTVMGNNSRINVNGVNASIGALSGPSTAIIENTGAATAIVSISSSIATTFDGQLNNGTNVLGINITSPSPEDYGTLTLGQVQDYTGPTNVARGKLIMATGQAIIDGPGTINVGTAPGKAMLVLNGGSYNRTQGNLQLGTANGANGVFVMNGGTFSTTNEVWPATANGGYGKLEFNGTVATVGNWLAVARGGGYGRVDLNGGTLSVTANNLSIGSLGGNNGQEIRAMVSVNGGLLDITNSIFLGEGFNGAGNNGVLNVYDGEVLVRGGGGIDLAVTTTNATTTDPRTGILNLMGGTVTTTRIRVGSSNGVGTLRRAMGFWNGGLVRPTETGANATFISGFNNTASPLSGFYILENGAKIDDRGQVLTVTTRLDAPTGNGISASNLTFSGSGYIGEPVITVFGGGGYGATAEAKLDAAGNITGIQMTSPGVGYTSIPSFTLNGGGGSGTVTVTALSPNVQTGGLTKFGSGTLILSGANTYRGTTDVTSGAIIYSGAGNTIGKIAGLGAVEIASTGSVTSDGVTVNDINVAGTLVIRANDGTVAGKAAGTSKPGTLLIAGGTGSWTGKLDLTNNALVLNSADAAAQTALMTRLADQVATGRGTGNWAGNGITSSTIPVLNANASANAYTLAIADAGDLGLTEYRGQTGLNANTTIVAFTRFGDATLDNVVDAFDLNILAANWQTGGKIWSSGDFTGDGLVDAFDLNVLAANWQFGVGGSLQAALAQVGLGGVAAVPEPASLAVLALGGAALLGRRRRKA